MTRSQVIVIQESKYNLRNSDGIDRVFGLRQEIFLDKNITKVPCRFEQETSVGLSEHAIVPVYKTNQRIDFSSI